MEHLILLDYLIVFLRDISKLSANSIQLRKKNLLAIAKYFCGSVFTRPYRPGHNEKVNTFTVMEINNLNLISGYAALVSVLSIEMA